MSPQIAISCPWTSYLARKERRLAGALPSVAFGKVTAWRNSERNSWHRRRAAISRRAGSPARSPRSQATLLATLREETAPAGTRRAVRRRRRSELAERLRLGHRDRGRRALQRARRRRRRPSRGSAEPGEAPPEPASSRRARRQPLPPGHMRHRLDQLIETNTPLRPPVRARPSSTLDGPGTRNGDADSGQEAVLAIVAAALRDSIRLVDEAFRLEEDALCVLAPNSRPRSRECGWRSGCCGCSTSWRPAGGLRISGLGRRRRLSRARRSTPRRFCARPTPRCGEPVRSGQPGRRRRACKIADRFRKSADNWCKPANAVGEFDAGVERSRTTSAATSPDARNPNKRSSRSARRQPQHAAQLGAPLRLPDARSAPPATTATTSWSSCRPCATRSPRPATSPRRSSWPASARRRRPAAAACCAAFESFDEAAADRAIEESLALRPLERTVEELLLPAIDELAADPEREAELEFASRWAMGWLHGARRLASTASRPAGILLLDSSHGQDAEAVHTQALDLALRRAGFRVLVLSNELGDERLERALERPRPDRDRPLRPRRRHRRRGPAGPPGFASSASTPRSTASAPPA